MSSSNVVLHVAYVHKSFGRLHALSDIDLRVREGTTHANIGPNGAGERRRASADPANALELPLFSFGSLEPVG